MVNKRRISACGYCGKRCTDITANSVTLCEISACGYFCGYFAWIGDISDILAVWYFGQSAVYYVNVGIESAEYIIDTHSM